jgi:hypothetical protein
MASIVTKPKRETALVRLNRLTYREQKHVYTVKVKWWAYNPYAIINKYMASGNFFFTDVIFADKKQSDDFFDSMQNVESHEEFLRRCVAMSIHENEWVEDSEPNRLPHWVFQERKSFI